MSKDHVVNVNIKNNTSYPLQFRDDGFDSGRLADGSSWPRTIAPGQSGGARCYEKDWALTGCSGWVRYTLNGTSLCFSFSNPLTGTNGIDFGTDTSVWDSMTGQYALLRRVVEARGASTWIVANIRSTSGTRNDAEWEVEMFDTSVLVDREPTLDDVRAVWDALPVDGDRQYYSVDKAPTSVAGMVESHFKGMCVINGQVILSHTNLVPGTSEDTGTWLVANRLPRECEMGAENWLFQTLPTGEGLAHPCSSQACGSFMAMGIQKSASSDSSYINIYDMRAATVGSPPTLVGSIDLPSTGINGVGITREIGPDGRYVVAGIQGRTLLVFRSRTSDLTQTTFDQVMSATLDDSGPGLGLATQTDGDIYLFAMNADPGTPCMFNLYQLVDWAAPGKGTCRKIGEKKMNIPGMSDTITAAERLATALPHPLDVVVSALLALGASQLNTSFRYGKGLRILSNTAIEVYASDRNVFILPGLQKDFGIVTWRSPTRGAIFYVSSDDGEEGRIYSRDLGGRDMMLFQSCHTSRTPAVSDSHVFFVSSDTGKEGRIYRRDLDGTDELLFQSCHTSLPPVVSGDHVFFVSSDRGKEGRIYRRNLDGTNEFLFQSCHTSQMLAISGTHVFFVSSDSGKEGRIYRRDLDGTNEFLFQSCHTALTPVVSGDHLFFVSSDSGKEGRIYRRDLDGTNELLFQDCHTVTIPTVSDGYVFFVSSDRGKEGRIYRRDLDGTNELLFQDCHTGHHVVAARGHVYFVSSDGGQEGRIYRRDLDGSNELLFQSCHTSCAPSVLGDRVLASVG